MVIQHNICYESVLHLYKTSTRRGNASIIYISILDFFHDTFPNPNRLSLKHQGLWRPQPLWEQTKARSQRPVIPSIFACRGARRLCPRHGHGNKLGRPAWGQRASQLPSIRHDAAKLGQLDHMTCLTSWRLCANPVTRTEVTHSVSLPDRGLSITIPNKQGVNTHSMALSIALAHFQAYNTKLLPILNLTLRLRLWTASTFQESSTLTCMRSK